MQIDKVFKKDIHRPINGVIQAGQQDASTIQTELEEYVITEEAGEYLATFYEHYTKSLFQPTGQMGVWISGFFGSGKSHFLKILSYLLANIAPQGKPAVEYFEEKTKNQKLLENLKTCAKYPADALLFNIESKNSTSAKNEKDKIVDVFLRVFNESLGYSSTAWIASIERQLDEEEKYEAFKRAFEMFDKNPWEKSRSRIMLHKKAFVQAMEQIGYDEETAKMFLDASKKMYEMSSDQFAHIVAEHCRKKGSQYRLIFLVDEIGQYIGDDTSLMLNLQTIVEDLGNYCGGQVWVAVTSQEKIDAVTKVKGDDFSKIQGRFATRISLSSANTDEVIKRRLLEKEEQVHSLLASQYMKREQSLKNILSFETNRSTLRNGYKSLDEFIQIYPFVPYQVDLLQKVFEKVRRQGEAGKHLAHGERSLLRAFQDVAIRLSREETGKLATFAQFYDTIWRFLDTSVVNTIKKAIQRADEHDGLEPGDIPVLKTLYLIKGIQEINATEENIATLLLGHVDDIKDDVQKQVVASLNRLKQVLLIEQNADQTYVFLSDEEQEVNREIKSTYVDDMAVLSKVSSMFFGDIFPETSVRTESGYDFSFNRQFNDVAYGSTVHALTLKVYTSDVPVEKAILEANSGVVVMRLPESVSKDRIDFMEAFEYAAQIEQFLLFKQAPNLTPLQHRIFDEKQHQITEFQDKGKRLLIDACRRATFYIQGKPVTFNGDAKSQLQKAFSSLIANTYTKLGYVDKRLPIKNAHKVIVEWAKDGAEYKLDGTKENHQALEEMERYLEEPKARRTSLKGIIEYFSRGVYGWNENDIIGLVALLLHDQKIKLEYNAVPFDENDSKFTDRLFKMAEREKVIIDIKVKIPRNIKDNALTIMREFFKKQFIVGETYEEVADEFRQVINEKMKQPLSNVQEIKRAEKPGYPYPGTMTLMRLLQFVQECIGIRDAERFVHELVEKEDELDDWFEQMEQLEEFYLGDQIKIFNGAVSLLQEKQMDIQGAAHHVDIQQIKSNIEAILREEKPYSRIQQLNRICPQLTDKLNELLETEREKTLPVLQAIVREWDILQTEHGFDAELSGWLMREKESAEEKVRQCEARQSVSEIFMSLGMAQRALNEGKAKVKAILEKREQAKRVIDIDPPTTVKDPEKEGQLYHTKEERVITAEGLYNMLVGQQEEIIIESTEQWDAYIKRLDQKVKALLDNHILVLSKKGKVHHE
ncbi:hypothetical protein DFP93_106113 [Aneurinibacillus soli]|uniref:Uncharacterized protein n=1 Tax=Aneurinibacillus soli TaxID=1500254 RepID=A0A0U4WNE4_9BACL|nr:BREX system P-loop protein BrxC [Aneurinibacillus soli]PYE61920.1 hypothetical protein DFP93_106113 [Aneurinibacillus soli]BAU29737.1 hypothetical protein CB4_03974 [Aneurinibacillus soli]